MLIYLQIHILFLFVSYLPSPSQTVRFVCANFIEMELIY